MERFYPLHAYVCQKCLLVKLGEYVSPEEIFGEYEVKINRGRKVMLASQVNGFRKENQSLETIIRLDKTSLQAILAQALANQKRQRPDPFTMTSEEQMARLGIFQKILA